MADDDNVSDTQAQTASVNVPSAGGQISVLASKAGPYVLANDSFFRWRLNGVLHSRTLVVLAGTYTAAQLATDLNSQVNPLVDGIQFFTDSTGTYVGVETVWAFGPDASFEFVSSQDALYGDTVVNGNPTGWGTGMTKASLTGSTDRYPQSYQTAGNYNLAGLTGLNIQIVVDGTDNVLIDNVVQTILSRAGRRPVARCGSAEIATSFAICLAKNECSSCRLSHVLALRGNVRKTSSSIVSRHVLCRGDPARECRHLSE